MDLERVKERIAKLLRVTTDDAATEQEIGNAVRAAQNLMASHHLEEADIEETDGSCEPEMGRKTTATKFGKVARWEKNLAHFVVSLIAGVCWYFSRNEKAACVLRGGRLKQFGAIVFYGIAEEAQLAEETYEELATTIFTMAMAKYGSAYRGDGGLYAEGFVEGLRRNLDGGDTSPNGQAGDGPGGTDLVARCSAIVQAKERRAKEWLWEECGIKLHSGSRSSGASGSSNARAHGKADGRNCDVSGVGARRAKLSCGPKLLTSALG